MSMQIVQASLGNTLVRLALAGIAGCGKTYSALSVGFALAAKIAKQRGCDYTEIKILVISSEGAATHLYAGNVQDGRVWNYAVLEVDGRSPATFTRALHQAVRWGADIVIIDTLTHAWDGTKEVADKGGKTGWSKAKPMYAKMMYTMLHAPFHLIATIRAKPITETEKIDNKVYRHTLPGDLNSEKDTAFEFDALLLLDAQDSNPEKTGIITKTRLKQLPAGSRWDFPGENVADAYSFVFGDASKSSDEWAAHASAELGMEIGAVNSFLLDKQQPALNLLEPHRRAACLDWLKQMKDAGKLGGTDGE